MKTALLCITLFALGALFGISLTSASASDQVAKPAYLIVSSDRVPGADYSAYSAAAGPLTQSAGIQMLASQKEPLVLEGSWPYRNITLETFPSMEAIKEFWYSDEYQQAKTLREGLSNVNFIVAIEAD